jgi:hypothetical protein
MDQKNMKEQNSVERRITMRNKHWVFLLIAALFFITPTVYANDFYYGFKLGYFEPKNSGVDNPDNAGIAIGYDWDFDYGAVGVEGEYTTTFEEGDIGGADVEVDTIAVYGVYHTRGPSTKGAGAYLKLKAGVLQYDLTVGNAKQDESEFAYGIGLGMNMISVDFELEFVEIDETKMITLFFRF